MISVAQTPNGDLWMGTRNSGLFRHPGGQTVSIINGLPDRKVNCLFAGGDQHLWVGTDNGVARWNGRELTTTGIPPTRNHFRPWC